MKSDYGFNQDLERSYIYAEWKHSNDSIGLIYYVVSWTPIGNDGDRIEQQEKKSDHIPYNSNNDSVQIYIYDIIQGECYDVRVTSVYQQEMQTHSKFERVQSSKMKDFVHRIV